MDATTISNSYKAGHTLRVTDPKNPNYGMEGNVIATATSGGNPVVSIRFPNNHTATWFFLEQVELA